MELLLKNIPSQKCGTRKLLLGLVIGMSHSSQLSSFIVIGDILIIGKRAGPNVDYVVEGEELIKASQLMSQLMDSIKNDICYQRQWLKLGDCSSWVMSLIANVIGTTLADIWPMQISLAQCWPNKVCYMGCDTGPIAESLHKIGNSKSEGFGVIA